MNIKKLILVVIAASVLASCAAKKPTSLGSEGTADGLRTALTVGCESTLGGCDGK